MALKTCLFAPVSLRELFHDPLRLAGGLQRSLGEGPFAETPTTITGQSAPGLGLSVGYDRVLRVSFSLIPIDQAA